MLRLGHLGQRPRLGKIVHKAEANGHALGGGTNTLFLIVVIGGMVAVFVMLGLLVLGQFGRRGQR